MQQRYYDPGIGRFLSVDPVTANPNTGAMFNRYNYANNNQYKFTDPDGRQSKLNQPCDSEGCPNPTTTPPSPPPEPEAPTVNSRALVL